MSYEAQGKLYRIFDTEQKTDNFRAREFVLEIAESQYPQMIKFQLTQDRCELLDSYEEGAEIKVHFDLRGREWNDRFFTNLNAWRIESLSTDSMSTSGADLAGGSAEDSGTGSGIAAGTAPDFDDDIPF